MKIESNLLFGIFQLFVDHVCSGKNFKVRLRSRSAMSRSVAKTGEANMFFINGLKYVLYNSEVMIICSLFHNTNIPYLTGQMITKFYTFKEVNKSRSLPMLISKIRFCSY